MGIDCVFSVVDIVADEAKANAGIKCYTTQYQQYHSDED